MAGAVATAKGHPAARATAPFNACQGTGAKMQHVAGWPIDGANVG